MKIDKSAENLCNYLAHYSKGFYFQLNQADLRHPECRFCPSIAIFASTDLKLNDLRQQYLAPTGSDYENMLGLRILVDLPELDVGGVKGFGNRMPLRAVHPVEKRSSCFSKYQHWYVHTSSGL